MIARMWRGATRQEDVERYLEYLRRTGLSDYGSTEGNRGSLVLCRREGGKAEFVVLSFWDSLESIRAFAGERIEEAVFYPEDDAFLVDRELTVSHFDVLTRSDANGAGD